jgi:RNA polymerase sigma-70 factor, ECF subfamily
MVNANKSDDLSLISRFKAGDISAFEEILLRHQDKIYNLCRRMLGNSHDAEDATQDVFLKAYQNINKFKPEASLYTWLFRIAVNTCIDYKREPFFESLFKTSKEGDVFVVDSPAGSPSPDRLYESKQISDAIQLTLSRLSAKLRAVIVLKEIEGLSYEEIAEVLDVSIGTVKSRISRARDDLKEVLKKFREQK